MRNILASIVLLSAPIALTACANASLSPAEKAASAEAKVTSQALNKEIKRLNHLTKIYIDAAAIYKQAAQLPDNTPEIKPALLALQKKRNAEREVLQDRIIALGGKPAVRGEMLGTGHRAFTSLRTIVDNDAEVAIEEVLRGERYIREEIAGSQGMIVTAGSKSIVAKLDADAAEQIEKLLVMDKTY